MRSVAGLAVLFIAGSVVLCGASNAMAQDPTWYTSCEAQGGCPLKAQLGVDVVACNYSACDPDAQCPLAGDDGIVTSYADGRITVRAFNWFVKVNRKLVRIRVEGNGATGLPLVDSITVRGNNNVPPRPFYPDSAGEIQGVPDVGYNAGNWWVDVVAVIQPQPHEDVLVFEVPGVTGVGNILDVRVWSCCLTGRTDIPTMSEWGLAVMALLVLAAGTLVYRRVHVSPA